MDLQKSLPAIELLKEEHVFVMDSSRTSEQDVRPLRIVVLNLMPLKIATETDLVHLFNNTPLQVELDFMKIKGHTPKSTPIEYMQEFYKDFDGMADNFYDGMIMTGAPVEQMPFEEASYWEEITQIFDWARTHVTSMLYICWVTRAELYRFYGMPKYDLSTKMFGIFRHSLQEPFVPILRGFDDEFFVPHSRHTKIHREDIMKVPEFTLLSESEESGVYMAMACGEREFFITGHSEYSSYTLNNEYIRDLGRGLPINKPHNYYRNNDPAQGPVVRRQGHASLLFTNWLNYYVYQGTPFRWENIKKLGSS